MDMELDSRFALMPGYFNLRRFQDGILSQNHHWAVYEYKAMMQVIVGAMVGLCPPEGIAVLREYLHIHSLAHYSVHMEKSLQWLQSAISTFHQLLKAPGGPFVKYGLIEADYEPQRVHYFRHYTETVRSKRSLPSYSTEATEIHHKPLHNAYKRSNKRGRDAIRFILKDQSTMAAFQSMVKDFDCETQTDESLEHDSEGMDGPEVLPAEESS